MVMAMAWAALKEDLIDSRGIRLSMATSRNCNLLPPISQTICLCVPVAVEKQLERATFLSCLLTSYRQWMAIVSKQNSTPDKPLVWPNIILSFFSSPSEPRTFLEEIIRSAQKCKPVTIIYKGLIGHLKIDIHWLKEIWKEELECKMQPKPWKMILESIKKGFWT